MLTDSVVLSLYFETPLHTAASGALGAIDLPIQRERTTQWPIIHAADVRSALRRALAAAGEEAVQRLLGGADGDEEAQLSIGDARLLLFPVRCSVAPFLWVTCPGILSRLRRDLERNVGLVLPNCPTAANNDEMIVSASWNHGTDALALEDVVLTPKPGMELTELLKLVPAQGGAYEGFAKEVHASLGLVSDEVFGFLVRSSTELLTASGCCCCTSAMEEMVPSDALFYVPVMGVPGQGKAQKKQLPAIQVFEKNLPAHVQVGEGVSLGRGWARAAVLKANGGTP